MKQSMKAAVVLCAAGLVLSAGCTKDKGTDKPSDNPSGSASVSSTPSKSATQKSVPLPPQPTFSGTPVGAFNDVKVVECPTDAGAQVAKLEVTNSSKAPRDYSIMVIWLKNGSGSPLGSGIVNQKAVPAGKKVALTVKAKVVEKADKCSLHVLAGKIK